MYGCLVINALDSYGKFNYTEVKLIDFIRRNYLVSEHPSTNPTLWCYAMIKLGMPLNVELINLTLEPIDQVGLIIDVSC